jgi:hypothetical protein
MLGGEASAGGAAKSRAAHTLDEAPLVESRFRYRLHDLDGEEVGTCDRDCVLEQDEVIKVGGERWQVVSMVGASARVARVGGSDAVVGRELLPPRVGRCAPSRLPAVQIFGYLLMTAMCLVMGWALVTAS